jgi:hypothetical protein
MLLLWEVQEKDGGARFEEEEEEDADADDLDFSAEEDEADEADERADEAESSEIDDYSSDSLSIDPRLKRLTLDSSSSTLQENHGPPVPGRYKLVASIAKGDNEAWWVWTTYGCWFAAGGFLHRVACLPMEMRRSRLEFWERF